MSISLLVPVRGRLDHLAALVEGLRACDPGPDELVIARMGGPDPGAIAQIAPCAVSVVEVPGDCLPLSRARNSAAAASSGDLLVLLDVDCVPVPGIFGEYERVLLRHDVLAVGQTRFRNADGDLESRQAHSFDSRLSIADDHENFWSLNFGLRRSTFFGRIGGFDDDYAGYGIEDTDFALSARSAGVPVGWLSRAGAIHQHHAPSRFDPEGVGPLLRNMRRFRNKWGFWPAQGWLRELAERGLVRWDGAGEPTPVPLQAAAT
jgi:glycosyltransferase involved in cell wall biosynthesis